MQGEWIDIHELQSGEIFNSFLRDNSTNKTLVMVYKDITENASKPYKYNAVIMGLNTVLTAHNLATLKANIQVFLNKMN